MLKLPVFLCCFMLVTLASFGQEEEALSPGDPESGTNSSEEIKDESTEEVQPMDQSDDIMTKSLETDIRTSNYDQLLSWVRALGLPDDGSESQLRKRLSEYYNVIVGGSAANRGNSGDKVVIESARRSEYFDVELDDGGTESIVRFTGEVVITIDEKSHGRKHQVSADSVLFNEKTKEISAVGNIEYIVDQNGKKEFFSGDSLVFEVNNWTGVIFHGTSVRNERINNKMVPFYFKGESIKRAGTSILLLEDGTISSDNNDNPDYSLKAKKIWITGPDEWAIFSATLYVGNVPAFYIPFYWESGAELFFNPVAGYRTDLGFYIQTTTYFLGKKKEDNNFSMLGFGSGSSDYDLVRQGIYVVKKPIGIVDLENNAFSSKNTLKLMIDGYSVQGVAAGIYGDFPELSNGNLEFYLSMGVSRSHNGNGNPYFLDQNDKAQTYWNSGYIGAARLPFRWGSYLKFKFKKWSLNMEWFSDPYYKQDFGQRKENFDWLKFILSEETNLQNTSKKSSLTWDITGSQSIPVNKLSPWLRNLSLSQIKTSLSWKNKTNTDISLSRNPDKSYDPARQFFYPDKLILPSLKVVLGGSFPKLSSKVTKKPMDIDGQSDQNGSMDKDTPAPSSENQQTFVAPIDISSYDSIYQSETLSMDFKYSIDSSFYMETEMDDDDWSSPSDINFNEFKAAKINNVNRGNFNYSMTLFDSMLQLVVGTKLKGYLQTHERIFGEGAEASESIKLNDYKYSKFLWDNNLTFTFNPLQGVPTLKNSQIRYNLTANIFSYTFDEDSTVSAPEYKPKWIANKEDLSKHDVEANFNYSGDIFNFKTGFSTNIPPLDPSYAINASAGASFWGFNFNVSQSNQYQNNQWSFNPLVMSASWKGWKNEVRISQSANFDIESKRLNSLVSGINFWGLGVKFTASHTDIYQWNTASYLWEKGNSAFLPSKLDLSFRRTFKPPPAWKNRIIAESQLSISWNINLIKFTENVLKFQWTQKFKIYKFIDLSLSFSVVNKSMYLYFPSWRDELGITTRFNFFEDLAKSFNFFNNQDRLDSHFNMEKLSVKLIHHLRNWDVAFQYSGWPSLNAVDKVYEWKSQFDFFIQWNPFPFFNQRTVYKNDIWKVESFGDNIDDN